MCTVGASRVRPGCALEVAGPRLLHVKGSVTFTATNAAVVGGKAIVLGSSGSLASAKDYSVR